MDTIFIVHFQQDSESIGGDAEHRQAWHRENKAIVDGGPEDTCHPSTDIQIVCRRTHHALSVLSVRHRAVIHLWQLRGDTED